MAAKDRRRVVLVVSAVAVLWWVALGLMVVLTANPVVLNPAQLGRARLVIEGRLSVEQGDTIDVLRVFASDTIKKPISPLTVVNLGDLQPPLEPARSYLVPLSPTGNGTWRIPGLRTLSQQDDRSRPIVYPADDVTRAQLEKILKRSRERARQSVMVTTG